MRVWLGAFTLLAPLSCAVSSQSELELELEVSGTKTESLPLAGGGSVRLARAELAFGPLTLCPGAQAGALCETARLEWRDAAVIDVLSATPQLVGSLVGMTGGVLSYMYDLGVVSLLGENGSQFVSSAARQLGDASLLLEGEIERDGQTIPFVAHVLVESQEDNEQGVPVVRKGSTETFEHQVTSADTALRVGFDVAPWVASLQATDFVQHEVCRSGSTFVCAGSVELTCATDGTELERHDCADQGSICAPDAGCSARVEFQPQSRAYRALVQALTAGARPSFEFR